MIKPAAKKEGFSLKPLLINQPNNYQQDHIHNEDGLSAVDKEALIAVFYSFVSVISALMIESHKLNKNNDQILQNLLIPLF